MWHVFKSENLGSFFRALKNWSLLSEAGYLLRNLFRFRFYISKSLEQLIILWLKYWCGKMFPISDRKKFVSNAFSFFDTSFVTSNYSWVAASKFSTEIQPLHGFAFFSINWKMNPKVWSHPTQFVCLLIEAWAGVHCIIWRL